MPAYVTERSTLIAPVREDYLRLLLFTGSMIMNTAVETKRATPLYKKIGKGGKEMSKIRKLIILCAVVLMMVVAVPPALAQGYYWDPAWLGGGGGSTPAAQQPQWQCGWYRSYWYGWQYWCWSPWYGWYLA